MSNALGSSDSVRVFYYANALGFRLFMILIGSKEGFSSWSHTTIRLPIVLAVQITGTLLDKMPHNNFHFAAKDIPGKFNSAADALSRFRDGVARQVAPMAQHNGRPHSSRDAALVKGVGQYILASLVTSSGILYAKSALRLRDLVVSLKTPIIWFLAPVSLVCIFVFYLLDAGLFPLFPQHFLPYHVPQAVSLRRSDNRLLNDAYSRPTRCAPDPPIL